MSCVAPAYPFSLNHQPIDQQACGTEHGPPYVAAALSLLGSVWAHIHTAYWQPPQSGEHGKYMSSCIHPLSKKALRSHTHTPITHSKLTRTTEGPHHPPAGTPAVGNGGGSNGSNGHGGDEGLVHAIGLLRWLTLVAGDCTPGTEPRMMICLFMCASVRMYVYTYVYVCECFPTDRPD